MTATMTATEQWARRGIMIMGLGGGFLPTACWIQHPLSTTVSGPEAQDTGKVVVARSSDAARRGYALPGEGNTAYHVAAQANRSERAFIAAGVQFVVGVLVFVPALLLLRRTTGLRLTRPLGIRGAIGETTGWVAISALFGAFPAFFLIGPLKLISDGAFTACLVAAVIGLTVMGARASPD